MAHSITVSQTIHTVPKIKYLYIVLILAFLSIASLMFYNLDVNPRSWHDEGAAMSVARTLIEDGVYAVRSSDGYQTFGPIQSVGPTVILPVALAFKLFGISILSARIVAVIYSIVALMFFFLLGKRIFGMLSAVFACLFLLAYPATSFFYFGRQVLGDYPALAFFLGALLIYEKGYQTGKRSYFFLSGILLGSAMMTKSQYIIMAFGALAVMGLLDFFINHTKNTINLLITGSSAAACFAAWMLWQYFYFGPATFFANNADFARLAQTTTGFHLNWTFLAVRHLFGSSSGYFFLFWGFTALLYAGMWVKISNEITSTKMFLLFFCAIWLIYYMVWVIPWPEYVVAACSVTALFVGKLFHDIINQLVTVYRKGRHGDISLLGDEDRLRTVTAIMAILPIMAYSIYSFYKITDYYILDKVGMDEAGFQGARSFHEPVQIVDYLNKNINSNAVIETWERELFIMTNHNYHFPDQAFLINSGNGNINDGIKNNRLGKDYFEKIHPDYIVVGWFARFKDIYDMDYLSSHMRLIYSSGNDQWGYYVYQIVPELD